MREIARAATVGSSNSIAMHSLPSPRRLLPLAVTIALSCLATAARADVKLPAIISDHMVLQADTPATVWGWADAGEKVTVKFADKTAETVAGAEGRWSVKLPELKPGTAGELAVAGKNSLTVKDVLVGEVWVCSGQSNMEWSVAAAGHPAEEAAAANFPQIRMFTVQRSPQLEPQEDCKGQWHVCSPETAPDFSAVGYYFGRKLHQTLKQPIGLIHTVVGRDARRILDAGTDHRGRSGFQTNPRSLGNEEGRLSASEGASSTKRWRSGARRTKAAKEAGEKAAPAAARTAGRRRVWSRRRACTTG